MPERMELPVIRLEHGCPVTVLVMWQGKGPRNCLVRRADGEMVVRPYRGLRKPKEAASA